MRTIAFSTRPQVDRFKKKNDRQTDTEASRASSAPLQLFNRPLDGHCDQVALSRPVARPLLVFKTAAVGNSSSIGLSYRGSSARSVDLDEAIVVERCVATTCAGQSPILTDGADAGVAEPTPASPPPH